MHGIKTLLSKKKSAKNILLNALKFKNLKYICITIKQNPMIRPEQPQPNYRGKATQTVLTPHGHSFEMCIDSDECDVTDELSEASKNLHEMFKLMEEIFSPNKK